MSKISRGKGIEAVFFSRDPKIIDFRKSNSFRFLAIPIEATFFSFSLSLVDEARTRPKGRIESSKPTRSGYPRFVLLHALPRGGRKEKKKGVEGSSSGQQRRAGGATPVAASTETKRRNVTTTLREGEEEEGEVALGAKVLDLHLPRHASWNSFEEQREGGRKGDSFSSSSSSSLFCILHRDLVVRFASNRLSLPRGKSSLSPWQGYHRCPSPPSRSHVLAAPFLPPPR